MSHLEQSFADTEHLFCDWLSGFGMLKPVIHGASSTITAKTEELCKDRCKGQTAFICAAVNYKLSDKTCELLAENNQTASVAEPRDDNWQHFIRPICAGK